MSHIREDFPIFQAHPDMVYLDSTATTQKPAYVIDGVAKYLRTGYANIHRGSYGLSEISETLYEDSKKIIAKHIGAESWREIIYTYNSTYALNLLAQSIWRSRLLTSRDTVLVSVVEHHANIVPWQILAQDYGVQVKFIAVKDDYSLDMDDLRSKLDDTVRVVSLTHVSNTTGQVFDLDQVGNMLKEVYSENKPIFIIDASQSVPHFQIDMKKLGCDALFFTGHKVFADSGTGVLWGKSEFLKSLNPAFSGGGAIAEVTQDGFIPASTLPERFEPGTPNLSGAVSLLKAFEYIEQIGGYQKIEHIEQELVAYTLEKFQEFSDELQLIGSLSPENRVGVFSFFVEGIHSHDIAEYLAEQNICIRAGQHCAEPAMQTFGVKSTCRMSLQIYNTREDIDRFFQVLSEAIVFLK